MTCAGCDDCPQDAWHLHVTVKPPHQWSFTDITRALECDMVRMGARPVVVTNHFAPRHNRPPYKELIPTKHFKGSESNASREIFKMGVLLNNSGWRVKRLKIEGDARSMRIPEGRALYYETHIKGAPIDGAPRSTNAKGQAILTVRRGTLRDVRDACLNLFADTGHECPVLRIEAIVLDTAPELDHDWINQ